MKLALNSLLFLFGIFLTLLMNGNLGKYVKLPIPAPAKFLDPFQGAWQNGLTTDEKSGMIPLSGLSSDATVYYDDRWVPHIFASGMEDALFLQGYIEAENRYFQMDFMARAADGELAAVLGDRLLQHDIFTHKKGTSIAADNFVKSIENNPQGKRLFDAYVNGVNAYFNQLKFKNFPIEYKLLNIKPEKWTIKKSALIGKSMAETLAGRSSDIRSSNSLAILGKEMFDKLYPEIGKNDTPVVNQLHQINYTLPPSSQISDDRNVIKTFQYTNYPEPDKNIGSNNWAIAGLKTASGKPIICNDPHLALSLPSIWFELQIATPDFNAYGVSIPGAGGIMSGFNQHGGWATTNVGIDIEDLILIEWENVERKRYKLDGKWVDAQWQIKEIKVRNKPSVFDTLYITQWGPVVLTSKDAKKDLARRWLSMEPTSVPEFANFTLQMMAKNSEEYLKSNENFITPAQNFVYAFKSGDIGVRINGLLPYRPIEDGRFVKDGTRSDYNWSALIPLDQTPQIHNPECGFVYSCNQRSASVDYPYYYTGKFEYHRNRAAYEYLQQTKKFSIEEMKQLQCNSLFVQARDLLPLLLKHIKNESHPWVKLMSDWDYHFESSSKAAVLYEVWSQKFYELCFDEILPFKDSLAILRPEDWRLYEILNDNEDDEIFDILSTTDMKETARDLIIKSWQMTVSELEEKYREGLPEWGDYRPTQIKHLLQIPAFSVVNLKTSGRSSTLNANTGSSGPSWRMVVHLDDEIEAWGIYPGGQSGNPASKFYKNMVNDWVNHHYYKLKYFKNSEQVPESDYVAKKIFKKS